MCVITRHTRSFFVMSGTGEFTGSYLLRNFFLLNNLFFSILETVILIMFAVFYTIYCHENVELTKIFKHQNQDINLYCGLSESHEV